MLNEKIKKIQFKLKIDLILLKLARQIYNLIIESKEPRQKHIE